MGLGVGKLDHGDNSHQVLEKNLSAERPLRLSVIQSRTSSTRFGAKCFSTLDGKPLVLHVIERALAIPNCDYTFVATTADPSDDALAEFVSAIKDPRLKIFRGDKEDVQSRFLKVVSNYGDCLVSRITADDPFRDPAVSALGFEYLENNPLVDYFSYGEDSLPLGLNGEVFRASALRRARDLEDSAHSREHVTPALASGPHFSRVILDGGLHEFASARLTVDYPADVEFNSEVAFQIRSRRLDFSWASTIFALKAADGVRESTRKENLG